MAQFAGNLNTMLDEQGADGGDGDAAADVAATARRPAAPGEAERPPTRARPRARSAPTRRAAEVAEPPRIRKIDSPASEPVDLAGDGRTGDPEAARPGARRGAAAGDHPAPQALSGRRSSMDDDDRPRQRPARPGTPRGRSRWWSRDATGDPVVIRNAPFLDDGTPMPTRYWLVGAREVLAVEPPRGGRRRAARRGRGRPGAPSRTPIAATRPSATPPWRWPPRSTAPTGGVGGTRQGVKCLHAHYAWFLAGGDDPVGRWVARQLAARLDVEVGPSSTSFSHAGRDVRIPVGPASLLATDLVDPDPPTAIQLTNAIGRVADHVDDVLRDVPETVDAHDVHVRRRRAVAPARSSSAAAARRTPSVVVDRDGAEEVFRALATETRADRLHNPGLEPARVDTVLAASCVLVGMMRRLQLDAVHDRGPHGGRLMARHPSVGSHAAVADPALRRPGHAAPARARRLRRVERGPPPQRRAG